MSQDQKQKNSNKTPHRKNFIATDENPSLAKWVKNWKSENYLYRVLLGDSFEKFRVGRIFFCLAFSFVFSFLLSFELNLNPSVKLGEVANRNIRAPFDFEVVDQDATELSKEKAVSQVPLVLDYYPFLYDETLEKVRQTFFEFKKNTDLLNLNDDALFKDSYAKFKDRLKVEINENSFNWLVRKKFEYAVERVILKTLEDWSVSYLANKADLQEGLSNGYVLMRSIGLNGNSIGEEKKLNVENIEALVSYSEIKATHLKDSDLSKYDQKKLEQILRQFRKPNLSINRTEYAQRKTEAKERVLPVVIPVKQNQIILKEGSLVQEQDVLLVNEVVRLKNSLKKKAKALVITLLLTVILVVGVSFLKKKFELDLPKTKQDFLILFGVSFVSLIIIKLAVFLFEGALYQKFGQTFPHQVILLLTPFSMLTMLAALLIRTRALLLLYIVYSAVGLSFLASDNFSFLIITLVAGMASVRAISVCKSRRDFYLAGLVTGAVIGVISIAAYAVKLEAFQAESFQNMLLIFSASVVGGILSSIFAVTLVPIFESFFDVMTDLKLLELSSLSHPLLKEMMVRAPGTYHHCMVVGSMVEAACNEIGVNGLQGKVMAYFHDVGKMEHAEYFVENQRKDINPHDHISPYLSKTIIIAHVKDGVEIILKHGLGKAILAGVKEHHGTTLIRYFYNKALKNASDEKEVKEEEFRYPGPKPQTKESAILMIADSIEAAARTIDDPNPVKIQNLIENMVDSKFSDGQLDECNITFLELTKIKKVFYKVLVGVYHHRVSYPSDNKDNKNKNVEHINTAARTVNLK